MRCVVLALASLLTAGCAATPAFSSEPVRLTIGGGAVLDAQGLQARGEAELSYLLSFGYIARTSADPVSCWFARTDLATAVDSRLWCGPVQVPGTDAGADWVRVPLKELERSAAGVRLEVRPPVVPDDRSTPVGELVRTDGRETGADQHVGAVGPDFVAVLPDDGRALDPASARIRDDQLDVRVTGYGSPMSWRTGQGELRAENGVRLRVLRLDVERLTATDSAFGQTPWRGWLPQTPELALDVPGRRRPLKVDRLPEKGSVIVAYTVPEAGGAESLVLNTVGTNSLEQRVEVPSGKYLTDVPVALRRGPGSESPVSLPVTVGDRSGSLEVRRVRFGRQRPVSAQIQYELTTAAPGKALVELRLNGHDLPSTSGAMVTTGLLAVTLPDGTRARIAGARYGGDTFPTALVAEVPADVRSVGLSVTAGSVSLPLLGQVAVSGGSVTVPLDF